MSELDVTVVRIYMTEGEGRLKSLLNYLHDDSKVHGVTVFRGITGFGKSGRVHSATLMDVSFDLPLVVEFFDEPDRARTIIEHLEEWLEPGHLVHWQAKLNS